MNEKDPGCPQGYLLSRAEETTPNQTDQMRPNWSFHCLSFSRNPGGEVSGDWIEFI